MTPFYIFIYLADIQAYVIPIGQEVTRQAASALLEELKLHVSPASPVVEKSGGAS